MREPRHGLVCQRITLIQMNDLLPSTLALLACPVCWNSLTATEGSGSEPSVSCSGCGRRYPIVDGIPVLISHRSI